MLVGAATHTRRYAAGALGTLRGYGVPVDVVLGPAAPVAPADLPLSLTIGAWLLHRYGTGSGRSDGPAVFGQGVGVDEPAGDCAALGARLAGTGQVGLLVLGDGSACRGEKAPGYLDPRAEPFDAAIAAALAEVDTGALLALDPVLAGELRAAGRAPWQVLAGAARRSAGSPALAGPVLAGSVLYDAAPYGVQYTVAVWR